MTTRLVARSALDTTDTPLGVVTLDENDQVTGFEPASGQGARFRQAVIEKWSVDELQGRSRLYTFIPEEPVQKAEPTVVEEGAEVEAVAGEIVKSDNESQTVFGWAYVTHNRNGELNIDKSGDFVETVDEIEKTAYDFVLKSRKGDADHTNVHASDLVESIVFTPDKIAKLGLPAGSLPLGWWVGFKVNDAATWDRVKKGELKAFSVHGKGTRKSVD